MTTRSSSIRTAWPGPPRHRHRRATSARWGTARRVVLGLVALLAGVVALNGVILAAAAPSRTSSNPDVDIASLLPSATAQVPADEAAAAPPEQVVVGKVAVGEVPTPAAGNSGSRPATALRPAREAQVTPRTPAAPGAAAGGPATGRRVEGAPGASAPGRSALTDEQRSGGGDRPGNGSDDADRSLVAERPRVISTPKPTPEPTPSQTGRPGRTGLLSDVRCAVDGVKIAGRSPLGSC